MNKKLLSFLMLIVVTVVLAACNGDSGNSDGAGEENGDTGEASSGDTEGSEDGEASDDGTEITFWHAMSGPHQDAITELTDAFNESQDSTLR